jgi:RNA polymerase-associated protein RTF1
MVFCRNAKSVNPASRSRGGRDDDSDVSDDDDEDGGGDAVPASEAQIRKIFLKRSTLEKWIAEPYFAQLAPGCMVRIGIGLDKKSGEPRYRLAEITQVAEGTHGNYPLAEYELYGKPGVKTPFHLVLKFGKHERAFKANEVSNQEPTAKEFAEWTAQMRLDEQRPLRVRDTDAALENIRAAENYRYTSEDVQAMLKKRQEKKGGLTHNLANQKEVLRRLVERAKAEGDEDAARDLSSQLDEVVKRLTKKLDKGGTQAIMANINKRNNAINDANLSRTAAEAIARAKSGKPDESANDPFSRRPTRMATYYTINGEKEREKTKEGEEQSKGTSDTSGAEVGDRDEARKRGKSGRDGVAVVRGAGERARSALRRRAQKGFARESRPVARGGAGPRRQRGHPPRAGARAQARAARAGARAAGGRAPGAPQGEDTHAGGVQGEAGR